MKAEPFHRGGTVFSVTWMRCGFARLWRAKVCAGSPGADRAASTQACLR